LMARPIAKYTIAAQEKHEKNEKVYADDWLNLNILVYNNSSSNIDYPLRVVPNIVI
jgi:hypothetical protein